MRCRFSIDPGLRKIESNELVVYDTELSEFISRKITRLKTLLKEPVLHAADVTLLIERIQQANISDPALRAEHVKQINQK
ncbi:hypothetical protein GCM10010911_12940 [Paenibacillus nasutitermitis]|uniref:Uncharacterized protein n=1 Tax=Paenibacillus nasutitermitis TaxID=1652958 RepID=A0A917DNU0_9BACL|nr:hypothetical protein GCM10010911_12940 [Paenibacillus nasutitermitis]